MNLNKKIVKTMVFALGLGMLSFAGVSQAKASGSTDGYNSANGVIKKASDAKFWAVVKKVKKEKGASFTLNTTDHYLVQGEVEAYSAAGIYVDAFGTNKEITVAIGNTPTPDNNWKVFSVKPSETTKTFKAGYVVKAGDKFNKVAQTTDNSAGSADAGFIVFTKGKKATGIETADKAKIQVKKEGGSWDTIANVIGNDGKGLQRLVQTGGTLYFKFKGEDGATATFPSREVRVKIPAAAKGPGVKADLSKEVFSTKKGIEYKVVKKDDEAVDDSNWAAAPDKDKLTFADVAHGGKNVGEKANDWAILFRTAASGKKGASKETKLILNKQEAPTKPDSYKAAFDEEDSGVVIKHKTNSAPLVTFKPVLYYDLAKKGAEVVNLDTANDYEFYIQPTATAIEAKDIKWVKLAKAKSADKPTKVKIRHADTGKVNTFKKATAGKFFIRLMGEKQTKENVVKLPSPTVDVAFTASDIEQTLKLNNQASEVTLNMTAPKTAKSFTLPLKLEKIQDKKAPIKIKQDKKHKGVQVELPKKFDGTDTVNVIVNVSEEAFLEAGDYAKGAFNLTVSVEGIKEQKFAITFEE